MNLVFAINATKRHQFWRTFAHLVCYFRFETERSWDRRQLAPFWEWWSSARGSGGLMFIFVKFSASVSKRNIACLPSCASFPECWSGTKVFKRKIWSGDQVSVRSFMFESCTELHFDIKFLHGLLLDNDAHPVWFNKETSDVGEQWICTMCLYHDGFSLSH